MNHAATPSQLLPCLRCQEFCGLALQSLKVYKPEIDRIDARILEMQGDTDKLGTHLHKVEVRLNNM